jgi:hypothetical protein
MSEDKIEQGTYPVAQGDEAAALVGGFAYDAALDRWSWSPEVFRIHGFEPHDVVPTTQLIRFHAHPEDRDAVAETLAQAMASPGRFNLSFRLVDARGTTRRVLLLGSGSGVEGAVRLRGQLVDLTSWQDQILNDDLGPVVDDFRAHRAVIEQAKGIVIQLFAVDADEAFDRLRACSQAANVKVRDLAEYLVIAAAQDRTPDKLENSLSLTEIFEVLTAENDPV